MTWLPQIVGFILLAVAIDSTLSCSCLKTHPQEHFCHADFVMLVTVKNAKNPRSYGNIKYPAAIHRIFKLTNATTDIVTVKDRRTFLYTPADEGVCGVSLETRTKYLVSGQVIDGQLTLDLCSSWIAPWFWVSKVQRKNLRSRYEANCDCKITTLASPSIQEELAPSTSSVCLFKSYSRHSDCFERETACVIDKNSSTGGCKWQRNKHMRKCRASKLARFTEP